MIKETVDAVRIAEMEAEKQIATAKENAAGEKAGIKKKEADYRAEQIQAAQTRADKAMSEVVEECKKYDLEMEKQMNEKVAELKESSEEKMEAAVEAVIDALI